ncbi:MAG: hypothetical protein QOE00_264 [Ilumatobacteraceae bacterium]
MRAVRSAAIVCGAVLFGSIIVPAAAVRAVAPIGDVLLSDVGSGFTVTGEKPGALDSLSRSFTSDHASLDLTGYTITDPPGVRTAFQVFSAKSPDFEVVPEPSLDLAVWFVPTGVKLGEGLTSLIFAAHGHIFMFSLTTDGASNLDTVPFVLALANRQIAAAGGPPPAATAVGGPRTKADDAVVAMLPAEAPAGYGLTTSVTVTGTDELQRTDEVQRAVVDFLNQHSATAVRVWSDDSGALLAAVSVTKYPYDIFAAASLGASTHTTSADVVSTDAVAGVPDVVAYNGRGATADQIGTAFRRGDVFVLVLVTHTGTVPVERAAALAADLTRVTAPGLPSGGTSAYDFPSTPSKLLGLAMSAALVTAAAGGSTAVGRLRARRVRQRWTGGALPPPTAVVEGAGVGTAISLDHDATRLRHQGAIVGGGQLVAVNVCIVALAGDFAWRGVAVAVVALVSGLLLTHWWQRRELGLMGSTAPPRQLVLPRPAGASVGLLSLAVLGFGVGFMFKGLRYLVLPPTLAQLKWSDLLGIAPRTVGILFALGGFVVAVLGGWLFRIGRALGRSGTRRVLAVDHRKAALYLRSFEDDSLPLPTIASARRPLFELFAVRGTDPFEESVAWELNSYGPVVAVGRPGRSLASLGAAREHLSDETWRDQVGTRMEDAQVIAIAIGETDGLAWELGHVVNRGHLGKTFFVFPPVAPAAIGRRWQHTAAALTGAGQVVGSLPVAAGLIHTVRIDADGTATVTYASRRDEATYRTAVDRTLNPESPAQT